MHIRSFIRKYLYSGVGIILILIVLIAVNALIQSVNFRFDMTEDKLFTLSDGTKKILKKIDTPVVLRFYCSEKENQMPVPLRSLAKRIEDMLAEYVKISDGKLTLEKFDPQPDSDAEDSATMDGISGQSMPGSRDRFYLGLAVNCLDKTVAIPIFSPYEEDALEYGITRSIYEACQTKMPVIGIMTKLPVTGGASVPFMQSQKPKPPWIFVQELKKNFEVKPIGNDIDKIPDDVNVLMIIHPQNLPGKTLFAIDQFLLKGGKLIVAVDPYCIAESRTSMQAMMGQQTMPGSSNMPELFSAWGINFTADKVVFDLGHPTQNSASAESETYPAVLDFTELEKNNRSDDPAMAGLNHLNLIFCGSFSGDLKDGLTKKVLLLSSRKSQLNNTFMAQMPYSQVMKDFKSDDKEKELILRITGKFKTAFPDGKPKEDEKDKTKGKDDKKDAAKTDSPESYLKESVKDDSAVILISDVDMLLDEFCVSRQNFLGHTILQPFNDNLVFAQNIAEQMSGDSNLISIRCKRIKDRPFTKIQKMQADAQEKFQKEIMELEEKSQTVQQRLNELQRSKSENQKFILSSEQKKEVQRYRDEAAKTNKNLKVLRKEFRKEIDSLQFNLELINIALIPALVVISGLIISIYNRTRSTVKK